MPDLPTRALILARISDARDGDTSGVERQVDACRKLAERLGWECGPDSTHLIVENATSAYKRKRTQLPDGTYALRTDREGFRRGLALLASGEADGLIALDLDRVARDPRDFEDLLDTIEARRIPVASVTGSLRLGEDGGVAMGRVMVAFANKSSRDTGRRVAAARREMAEQGRFGGGPRPFGFEPDGVTVRESEAQEIRDAADKLLGGVSVRQIVADLRLRAVPTVSGTTWKPTLIREVLRRPRNAGLMVYHGEVVGRAPWEPILAGETWKAVLAVLDDPSRRTAAGNTPKWLLSGLARCGTCGETVHVWGQFRGRPAYHCPGGHVHRAAPRLDEYVGAVVVARLAREDAAELVQDPAPGVDALALRREAASLRARLNEQAVLHARGILDGEQLAAGSGALRARLADIDKILTGTVRRSPLAGLAGNDRAAEVWDAMDLGRKRAALAALCTVTLTPAAHGRLPGGAYLDTTAVQFDWLGAS
ncbi:MAG: recombinase family protein [Streptosporangiaceae bacterium]